MKLKDTVPKESMHSNYNNKFLQKMMKFKHLDNRLMATLLKFQMN